MPPSVILSKTAAGRLAELPDAERQAVLSAIKELPKKFGRPHLHAGLGIRRLGHDIFEFRASLALRGLFYWAAGRIYVDRLGSHDDLQNYLRNVR
jgi:hypothetical protein